MTGWKKDILIRIIDLENQCIDYEEEIINLKKKVTVLENNVVKKTTKKEK